MIKRETKANEPIQLFLANSTDPNLSDFVKSALSHPNGLTKREYFAAMAMQGIIANKDGLDIKIERIVESAVDTADALIEELYKTR